MFKRIFAIATMLCVFPVMAHAWTLTTWVKAQGGTITSPNKVGAQTVLNGSLRKSYTTASEAVTITPDPGFRLSKLELNGIISNPNTITATPITATAAGTNRVYATFARVPLSLSATAGPNGSVDKTSYSPIYAGSQSPAKTFTFTPNPGFAVASITPSAGTLDVNYQYLNAITNDPVTVPAATGVKVKVYVVNVPTATSITFDATFSGTATPPATTPTAANAAQLARTQCENCHASQGVGAGTFAGWSSSMHKGNPYHIVMCYDCHVGADVGAHPGTAPTNATCQGCHSGQYVAHKGLYSDCAGCHNPHSLAANPVTVDHSVIANPADNSVCGSCHKTIVTAFTTSQHGTRQGKATWYNDNLGNPAANELQKGFGNYVNIAYTALPCGKCHNAAAWTPAGGTDQWLATTGGVMVCNDCHGNKAAGVDTTAVDAPVTKTTCFGCHSRQMNETAAGLSDVHFAAGMGCPSCHSTSDMHGTGTQTSSQLVWGTISAQCENCHGAGKSQGPISSIAAHVQHAGNIACSTCHAESMITCHNCHFDNEAGAGGAAKAKFFSGRFGGTVASGNSWRFLVNRVMPDGSTKVYPGSMQSLVADYTVDNVDGGQSHTHAGIAPYYSHTITRINALSCDKCHGTETAVKLAAGQPVRVTTWTAAAGVPVAYTAVQATFIGPKGVIPVPENPKGKLLMDFVDLTNPGAALTADKKNSTSDRILLQKDGPDTIHMPEAFVKPLTAAQMQKLSMPYSEGFTTNATAHAAAVIGSDQFTEHTTCGTCHKGVFAMFSTSQHGTRQGKDTWYSDNLGNAGAAELQKGFGSYVNVAYATLPCGKCHNAAAWTPPAGSDQWAASTGGVSVCTDCHGNKAAGADTTTVYAPVAKTTCLGCHSRQANETAAGMTDVHATAGMICTSCHSTTDMHGTGTQTASQLQWGTISAQCENCHVAGGSFIGGAPSLAIPEHSQHMADIACSTCHAESMITCHNCHFDNEAGAGGATKAKFFSGRFGGTGANSWRFLVNRVMPDGSTKVYPGSMQSLAADYTVDNVDGALTHTHAGIAPYYSHAITKVNALRCDKCHGTAAAIALNTGSQVRVTTWNAAAGVPVPYTAVQSTFIGPQGVIPVPENPRGKLLMDFVDLTTPDAPLTADKKNSTSDRVLLQKDGPDTIHMPEAYVKPLTAAQILKLATPQVRP